MADTVEGLRLQKMHRRAQRAEARVQRALATLTSLEGYMMRNNDPKNRFFLPLEYLRMVKHQLELRP